MTLADLIRRESDALNRLAGLTRADHTSDLRAASVKLRNIAGVVEVHGYAGLHGYLACLNYSHSVEDKGRNMVLDIIGRILKGEAH